MEAHFLRIGQQPLCGQYSLRVELDHMILPLEGRGHFSRYTLLLGLTRDTMHSPSLRMQLLEQLTI